MTCFVPLELRKATSSCTWFGFVFSFSSISDSPSFLKEYRAVSNSSTRKHTKLSTYSCRISFCWGRECSITLCCSRCSLTPSFTSCSFIFHCFSFGKQILNNFLEFVELPLQIILFWSIFLQNTLIFLHLIFQVRQFCIILIQLGLLENYFSA